MSRTADRSTSSRGHETRRRILGAALSVFGDDGFDQATTRRIADEAHVALPAIKYYFDNKEGLYLACAEEIVSRYQSAAGEFLRSIVADLRNGCSSQEAREHLKSVMRSVSDIAEAAGTEAGTAFVLREMNEQGPAFDVLYRELWGPGVRLTAALIARIQGDAAPGREAHVRALMLHASLTAFTVTLPVSLHYLVDHGTDTGGRRPDEALSLIEAQIDEIGRSRAG